MAGDWIKMRIDLQDAPAVVAMAAELGMDEYAIVGRLHKLWGWADRHLTDGHAKRVTQIWIDQKVSCSGFAAAMESAGWISFDETGLTFPEFDKHNGKGAKTRAEATERKQVSRDKQDIGHKESGQVSHDLRDTNVTREEKRREVKTLSGKPDGRQVNADAVAVLGFLNEKTGRRFEAVKANVDLIAGRLRDGATVDTCKQVILNRVGKWAGDEKMAEFLRPATLFAAKNFAQYTGELGATGGASTMGHYE